VACDDIRRNLSREQGDVNWILCDLWRAIYREISIMEAGSSIKPDVKPFHATALFYTGTNKMKKLKRSNTYSAVISRTLITYPYCYASHWPKECKKFDTVEERKKKIIIQDALCYNCLGKHNVAQCRSHTRCYYCRGKHHTSIYQKKDSQRCHTRSIYTQTGSSSFSLLRQPFTVRCVVENCY